MDFINHQIFQCLRPIFFPQGKVFRTDQQVIQHFIVGQQNIRGRKAQGLPISDELITAHDRGGVLSLLAANVEPRFNLVFQVGVVMNEPGHALGLVCGEGIHGVDDDGFDTPFPSVSPAVIQDRIEKTFRLSRPGARGDNRGGRLLTGKTSKCLFLMQVRCKEKRNTRE